MSMFEISRVDCNSINVPIHLNLNSKSFDEL